MAAATRAVCKFSVGVVCLLLALAICACQTTHLVNGSLPSRAFASSDIETFQRTLNACNSGSRVIRAATYNLLNKNVKHAKNYDPWSVRSSAFASWVRSEKLDVLTTQEGVKDMIQSLKSDLQDFTVVGRPRSNDSQIGEYSAIFYKTARFTKQREGNFWLSPTPDVPESRGWGAAITRLCTWVELQDNQTGKPIFVFNAHYDYAGIETRTESSKLIMSKIKEIAGLHEVVLLGDFNTEESSADLEPIAESGMKLARANALTQPEGSKTTFADTRIDHVFVGMGIKVCRFATKIPKAKSGKALSDHFPVVVDLVDLD